LLYRFQKDTPAFLMDLRRQYGEASSFFLNGELFMALFSPEMVYQVTTSKQGSFVKGMGFARMRKVLGEGLLTNEEPIHLRHRRMMQPPFKKERLNSYSSLMTDLTREQISTWQNQADVLLGPEMMRLTLAIVAQTLFGTSARKYEQPIAESMEIAIDRIERTMLPGLQVFDDLPVPYWRKFGEAADELALIAEELIKSRREDPHESDDLLGLLLSLQDDDGVIFTDEEVRDEALTLILSGHETTANMLTWAFSWLATRPDIQDSLHAEAERAGWPNSGTTPSIDEVLGTDENGAPKLPVSAAIVSESLRMAPPVWVAPRRAIEDVEVDGVQVPAGAHVIVSQYVTQRDERWFPEPNQWRPERWYGDLAKQLPRGAYFPFGGGTRKCLGDQFALLESRIILLEVAARMKLKPIDANQPVPKAQPRATYRPKGPVPMRVSFNQR
jgi:cytochrome P450